MLLPGAALAQNLAGLDQITSGMGQNAVLMVVAMTVLSLVPALAVTVTCFPFIVTVLSILRQSLGLQQSPPNMLIIALALFLTWFVMEPVLTDAWIIAGAPLQQGNIGLIEAFQRGIVPFRAFMELRTDPGIITGLAEVARRDITPEVPLSVLMPSFMLSEITRAFEIGFLVALPFLIIDLVVSAVLMSMGMMMVPPAIVSLPFKLAFFVAVDGWALLSEALVRSYQG
ncbi:MAG: flagellar type III secretion system pore protein FliP [Paracoccus sp. (in: a-proteobacteria)]|uniref:flagellar type III secretion system pore protein FliP n=1 Tax=Paracoccus sp. TaxID=267 RepID=UPI0026E018A6|nr:flagellar type III secretion system pore protein FliP [Paracoccus sp. (in: a-proteobacteria)]MDO5621664.1 flagellar type III secretion system pore protein FliP [Paracoccus sp. (in: a-proteobacteria)]